VELKRIAVENEDYEEAKSLKIKIDKFKQVSEQIVLLEQEKVRAVDNEDYDKAKQIKSRIDQLRNSALDDKRPLDRPIHGNAE